NIVLPCIYREFPQAPDTISRTIAILPGTAPVLDEAVNEARNRYMTTDPADGTVRIDLRNLIGSHPSAAPALLFELLRPYGFTASQIQSMTEATDTSGATFQTSEIMAVTSRGMLELTQRHTTVDNEAFTIDPSRELTHPIHLVPEFITPDDFVPVRDNSAIYLDSEALAGNPSWELRRWRHGDRLIPYGMKGSRKLSDIFSDAGMSVAAKRKKWVLTRNGTIVWIPGIRAAAIFPVTGSTRAIVKISYLK
ncbi:MAG: tRNA lysidine(34) synthetase TilS, partial [Muribaculaceae bacterium]|nr:tRNA lysidine(34) synthetase TilS [Muribaculaceae bacterium]